MNDRGSYRAARAAKKQAIYLIMKRANINALTEICYIFFGRGSVVVGVMPNIKSSQMQPNEVKWLLLVGFGLQWLKVVGSVVYWFGVVGSG